MDRFALTGAAVFDGETRVDGMAVIVRDGLVEAVCQITDLPDGLSRVAAYGWKAQGIPQLIANGVRAGTRVIYAVGPDGATIEFMQPPAFVQDL